VTIKERYNVLKAQGVCVVCGYAAATDGKTRCDVCRSRDRKCNNERYRKGISTESVRQAARERYQRMKAAGLCTRCGKPVTDGHARCWTCRQKDAEWRYLRACSHAVEVSGCRKK
jgi:predicted amidophosphoribosyltransferase